MPTILIKKSDTPGSVPGTANLTNLAGGAEVAVNTADRRMFTMNSSSAVVELGTNPSSLTCADGSFTLLKAASASITNLTATSLVLSNLSIASANVTTLTSSSATISTTLALSGGTANGVLYLNGSKVATSGSGFTYDGTSALISGGNFRINRATNTSILTLGGSPTDNWEGEIQFVTSNSAVNWRLASNRTTGGAFTITPSTAGGGSTFTTPAMTIDNASNVGIGTSSPGAKLDVNGNVHARGASFPAFKFADSSGNAEAEIYYGISSNDLNLVSNQSGGVINLQTGGGVKATLDASGNLGIGTSSPNQKLDVAGSVQIRSSGTHYLNNSDNTNQYYWQNIGATGANNATLILSRTNAGETLRLDSSGNLGLGTTTNALTYALTLYATGSTSRYMAVGNSNTGLNGTLFGIDGSGNTAINNTQNFAMLFLTNNTERARITSDGKLLVNCTNGNGRLTVRGPGTTTGYSFEAANSGGATRFLVSDNGLVQFYKSDDAESARITSGGELLVGTTSASLSGATRTLALVSSGFAAAFQTTSTTAGEEVLCLQQSATSGDNIFVVFKTEGGTGTGRGSISYNRGAGQVAYNVTSDVRLKENIANAEEAGSKIDAMQVRQFDWKETGNHLDYGFVAQELHAVAPHAVSKPEDEETMWSVDYSKLVPMLIKEVQSLRKRVAELEAK